MKRNNECNFRQISGKIRYNMSSCGFNKSANLYKPAIFLSEDSQKR